MKEFIRICKLAKSRCDGWPLISPTFDLQVDVRMRLGKAIWYRKNKSNEKAKV